MACMNQPRFRAGDWVTYVVGRVRHACEVLSYVGPVGRDDVPYYRLREPVWYSEPQEFDFPETALEPASVEDLARRYPPDRQPDARPPLDSQ
jgi:hypothetical protein